MSLNTFEHQHWNGGRGKSWHPWNAHWVGTTVQSSSFITWQPPWDSHGPVPEMHLFTVLMVSKQGIQPGCISNLHGPTRAVIISPRYYPVNIGIQTQNSHVENSGILLNQPVYMTIATLKRIAWYSFCSIIHRYVGAVPAPTAPCMGLA